jgi:hypothetical protein
VNAFARTSAASLISAADRASIVARLDAALNELDEVTQSAVLPSQDDRLGELLAIRQRLNALANAIEAGKGEVA